MKHIIWKIMTIIAIIALAFGLHYYGSLEKLDQENVSSAMSLLATLFSFLSGFIFIIYTKASEFAILENANSDSKIKDNYKNFLDDLEPINCIFYLYLLDVILIIGYTLIQCQYLLSLALSSSTISIILSFGLPHFYEHPIRNKGNRILKQRNE